MYENLPITLILFVSVLEQTLNILSHVVWIEQSECGKPNNMVDSGMREVAFRYYTVFLQIMMIYTPSSTVLPFSCLLSFSAKLFQVPTDHSSSETIQANCVFFH